MESDRDRLGRVLASLAPARLRASALAARHAEVTAAHLVAALLEDEEVQRAVVACGADLEEVTDMVAGTVDAIRHRRWWQLRRGESAELQAILRRAVGHAVSADLDTVAPAMLLVHVLAAAPDSAVVGRLEGLDVERLRLMLLLTHGDLRDPPLPAGTGRARVMLHDDPFTTKELVVEVLVDCFGHAAEQAERLMQRVHRGAPAVVHADDWEPARERAEAARARARAKGFPLRLTLEP